MSDDLYLMRARDDATNRLLTAQDRGALDDALTACRRVGVVSVRIDGRAVALSAAYWYRSGQLSALESLATA